jgi:uncharacterized membrane protein YiaA
MGPPIKSEWGLWAWDAGERAARAYAISWVAIVGGDYVIEAWNATMLETFKAAFFGVLVSALFSLAGKTRGAKDSASLLERSKDPPAPA